MLHASSALRKIFRETIRREPDNAPLLAWPLACGAKIAERTNAIAFADGLLTISVPDETWRYQLQNLSPQYLAALNQVTPQRVTKIDFIALNRRER